MTRALLAAAVTLTASTSHAMTTGEWDRTHLDDPLRVEHVQTVREDQIRNRVIEFLRKVIGPTP